MTVRSGQPRPRAVADQINIVDSLPLILHLCGLYVAVPIPLPGGIQFPVATTLVTVPLLLALNAYSIRVPHVAWIAALVAVAGLTLVFAPNASGFLIPRLKGLLLWTFSIVGAYALMLEMIRWPRDRLAKLMLAFCLAILAGCLLEIFGGLRAISDAFRRLAFPMGELTFRQRDLEIAGFERPRLFTSEPSDVAKFFLLASLAWVVLATSRAKHVIGLTLCLAATALTRSPIAVLLLPLQGLVLVLGKPLIRRPRLVSRPIFVAALAVIGLAALGGAAGLIAQRITQVAGGRDPSSVIRIVVPVVVAAETLESSPWWGAGISGTEAIEDSIVVGYELAGVASLADPTAIDPHMTLANIVGNAFWLHWINLGLLGGVLAIWILRGLMKSLGVRRVGFAFAAIFVFSQTMGAAHGPYFWSYIAVCVALAWQLDASDLLELRLVGPVENAVRLQQPSGTRI